MWGKYMRIFCGILLVPCNIVMDLNNVMNNPKTAMQVWEGKS